MSTTSQKHDRYALSFTSGALLTREAVIAAPLFLEVRDWNAVRNRLRAENLLQARTASSGFRLAREVAQRLA
ncbi:BrxA family protein, partial [Brachybacterium sp. AOP35-5H-19]|uniref:BrxA family protein n=1 Tax=Brachybacterium sp. AOP35-5H-19 TaxID=3457685 RepID=UPI004034A336